VDEVIDRWLLRFAAQFDATLVMREGDPLAGVDRAALQDATV